MARRHKMCLLGLLTALVLMLCGCSASDLHLPEQVDLFVGDSFPLASAVEWDGETDAASAALLLTAAEDNGITVSCASADPGIAMVDGQGIIQAAAPGETTVTVSCPAFGYEAQVAVTVSEPLGGLYMESTLDLQPGQTGSLNPMLPGGDLSQVRYAVADTAVASVDADGTVTALAEGITAITATVEGSSLTAECEVVVGTPVQGVQVSRPAAQLDPGQTMVLSARVWPDREAAVHWSTTDPAVATVDEGGKVTALTPGTAEIVAEVSGRRASCTLTVTGAATAETATAETATAETAAPATPENATPESATPESAAPETATAETATPESTAAPETSRPMTPEAATSEPAAATGETAEEDAAPAAAMETGETAQPAVPESAGTPESAALTPETAQTPEPATPESATPESATPETATGESAPQGESPAPGDATGGTASEEGGGWLDWLRDAFSRFFGG